MLVSKRKRYLSGQDWVICTLDRMMKEATGVGNLSQVVLPLEGRIDAESLRDTLARFTQSFPVLHGRVRRDIKLAPYWSIPPKSAQRVLFTVHDVDGPDRGGSSVETLEQLVNAPFDGEDDHVAFHLVRTEGSDTLSMVFDHRLFDARGAELFLDLFQAWQGTGTAPETQTFTSSAALTDWTEKFLAGRNVNRRIMTLAKTADPAALDARGTGVRTHRFRIVTFSEAETAAIQDRAANEAGYLMESPYLLAMVTRAIHRLFTQRDDRGADYVIPVTTDLRTGQEPAQETFFNHVSYLFYRVPATAADDRAGLITLLKQQMYDQVKANFPRDLAQASLLTRIAPLPLLGKLLHLPMKGRMATFAFSHLGRSGYRHDCFFGARIRSLFHMPRVPLPPGIGFFSNSFQGKLTLVISHLDGLLAAEEIDLLERALRSGFAGEADA